MISEKDAKRFWRNVAIGASDECWPWQGFVERYGKTHIKRVTCYAHRVAYEIANGSIPDGLGVLHSCDNPPCCNPAHLFAGTQKANVDDMVEKGRHRFGTTAGIDHYKARVTEEVVVSIRKKSSTGRGIAALSREYGVSKGCIASIVKRRTWKAVA